LSVLGAAALVAACGGARPSPPAAAVSVAVVVEKSVTEWDEFSGRIEAIENIEVRPRVTGYLAGVHFREGGEVHRGDLLFTVDDREFAAATEAARANLARAEARLALAKTQDARSHTLAGAGAASAEEIDQRRGELDQATADRDGAQAQLRQAELNLGYTQIRAAIDGRVGRAEIRPGNVVTANVTRLTTLVSLDPVYVAFDGDERVYLKYESLARAGSRPSSRDVKNPVRVGLASETGFPHAGEMVFVDNALDPATGTIHARARLANSERVFTPGLFARVQLLGSGEQRLLLVHERAVLTDQDRRYVYVIGDDRKAQRRDVELGPAIDGLRVIRRGLVAGDHVVVNGTRKIFVPGQPVVPTVVPMTEPEAVAPVAGR
jgi:multidrug efflux system membrane fusion protein